METSRKTVSILGPRKLSNRLLCEHLNFLTDLSCTGDQHLCGAAIALVDYDEEGRYLARPSGIERPGVWALFSVPQGRSIEKGAFAAGYRGFFYREDDSEVFAKGLKALAEGEFWIPRRVLTECLVAHHSTDPARRPSELTRREREIITLISTGLPNDEIGASLNISAHTVKTHTYRIFRKIGVSNRFQAARWASANIAPASAG